MSSNLFLYFHQPQQCACYRDEMLQMTSPDLIEAIACFWFPKRVGPIAFFFVHRSVPQLNASSFKPFSRLVWLPLPKTWVQTCLRLTNDNNYENAKLNFLSSREIILLDKAAIYYTWKFVASKQFDFWWRKMKNFGCLAQTLILIESQLKRKKESFF